MSLEGKTILVTRGGEQGEELAALVRARGGVPVLFPTVRIVPPDDPAPLDGAIARLDTYDGLLFTSANAARFFCERAAARGVAHPPLGVLVGSVGPGTTRALRRFGYPVHVEASVHTAEGLAEALGRERICGKRFLLPRAAEGREVLPALIGEMGGAVEAPVAYRTVPAEPDAAAAAAIVADPPAVATFASPSALRNFFRLLGDGRAREVLSRGRLAVIGEVTARAAAELALAVDIVPKHYTLEGMLDAIEADMAAREGAARGVP